MNQFSDRTCRSCGKTKPIEGFNFSHKARGWRRHECIDCQKERQGQWYKENHSSQRKKQNRHYHEVLKYRPKTKEERASLAERSRRQNAVNKERVYQAYGGYVCACCGETEPAFLSIDHVNNDGYKQRKKGIQGSGGRIYRWLISNNFPPGYQVLCMNCQHGKARNNGVCPHKERSTTIPLGSTLK